MSRVQCSLDVPCIPNIRVHVCRVVLYTGQTLSVTGLAGRVPFPLCHMPGLQPLVWLNLLCQLHQTYTYDQATCSLALFGRWGKQKSWRSIVWSVSNPLEGVPNVFNSAFCHWKAPGGAQVVRYTYTCGGDRQRLSFDRWSNCWAAVPS